MEILTLDKDKYLIFRIELFSIHYWNISSIYLILEKKKSGSILYIFYINLKLFENNLIIKY